MLRKVRRILQLFITRPEHKPAAVEVKHDCIDRSKLVSAFVPTHVQPIVVRHNSKFDVVSFFNIVKACDVVSLNVVVDHIRNVSVVQRLNSDEVFFANRNVYHLVHLRVDFTSRLFHALIPSHFKHSGQCVHVGDPDGELSLFTVIVR